MKCGRDFVLAKCPNGKGQRRNNAEIMVELTWIKGNRCFRKH
jgi:hypothetical protein